MNEWYYLKPEDNELSMASLIFLQSTMDVRTFWASSSFDLMNKID